MASFLGLLLVFVIFLHLSKCIFHSHLKIKSYPLQGDAGDPLMLTPLIESGKIREAQEACKMSPMKSNITSYAGFITVDKNTNSNMFFIFFPAYENNETAPILLWLQGGPGASSLYGLFNENGPFSVKRKHGLKLREHTWTKSHSVIYIDNPVGTGYSFTNNGYSSNQDQIGYNLYNALIQFFTLFPQFQKNDFFVTGESYAGKYVPSVSYAIHTRNPSARLKINLKGLAIGNGLCDPEHMLNYGDYLYQNGLLDQNGRGAFKNKQQKILQLIQQKRWQEAFSGFDYLISGDKTKPSLFQTLTGFDFHFNYLHEKDYSTSGDIGKFLSYLQIRKNLHVGNVTFNEDSTKVENYLIEDIMKSVKSRIETLVENYRVLIYNGQLDIIVPFPLTEDFLDSLNWSGASEYKTAPRKLWYVGEELAGYAKVVRKLTVVLVRNAGHMVPMDQPKWSVELMSRFTRNKPF